MSRLGALTQWGDGRILVYASMSGTPDQRGWLLDPGWTVVGKTAFGTQHLTDPWVVNTYSHWDWSSGIYDPVTGLNYLTYTTTDSSNPYALTGYSNAGVKAREVGNALVAPDADRFAGADGYPPAVSLIDRWLYRFSQPGDSVMRYNLDTDVWQYTWFTSGADIVGVLPDGTLVGAARSGPPTIYLYGAGSITWTAVSAINGTAPLSTATATYSITTPSGGNVQVTGSGDGAARVVGTTLYYFATFTSPRPDYGGAILALYGMDLTTGTSTLVGNVPYRAFHEDGSLIPLGTELDDPDYYDDTGSNGPKGLLIALPLGPSISGDLVRRSQAFTGT